MAKKKPYRLTKVVVEVLTAGDYNPPSLDQVVYDIREGGAVGLWDTEQVKQLDKEGAVKELERMGSDASFLECLGNTGEL